MSDLKTRLLDWQTVHPCDADKPEGHLYEEAAARIDELEARVVELEQTVDGIWRYAVDTTVADHHFRGWAEVEARAALEASHDKD